MNFNSFATADPYLLELLRRAADALEKEEQALNRAFNQSSSSPFYVNSKVNQGLGYWLYETTLVYVVFKAWIRCAPAVWDWDRSGRGGALDLTVRDDGPGHSAVRYAFEAKWWNYGTTALFAHDTSKLQALQQGRRFIMAFWWTRASDFARGDAAVDCAARADRWARVFQATFPMHHGAGGDWLFVMDVAEVSARGGAR